jgi:hypothetical protein
MAPMFRSAVAASMAEFMVPPPDSRTTKATTAVAKPTAFTVQDKTAGPLPDASTAQVLRRIEIMKA